MPVDETRSYWAGTNTYRVIVFGKDEQFVAPSPDDHKAVWACRLGAIETDNIDQMGWCLSVRYPFAVPGWQEAKNKIHELTSDGWINLGWFQSAPIGGMLPPRNDLAARYRANPEQYEIAHFWFADDDTRSFLLTRVDQA